MQLLRSLIVALGIAAMPAFAAAPAPPPQTELAPPPPAEVTPVAADPSGATPAASSVANEVAPPAFDHAVPTEAVGMPDGRLGIHEQVTPLGRQARDFHDYLLMPIITVISVFVLALLLWVVIRYNRRANPTPSKTSHNTVLEVLWTLVPVLILLVIAVPSLSLLANQYDFPEGETVTVKITGHQWNWEYEYPDHGVGPFVSNILAEEGEQLEGQRFRTDADGPRLLAADERMVIPVDTNIRIQVTASTVLHSFAVPAFWTKIDAVPGRLNERWFRVDREGVYFGQCSELCGARHAYMPIAVEVVSRERFAQWVAARGGTMPGTTPAESAPDAAGSADAAITTPAPAVNETAPAVAVDQAATANQGSNP